MQLSWSWTWHEITKATNNKMTQNLLILHGNWKHYIYIQFTWLWPRWTSFKNELGIKSNFSNKILPVKHKIRANPISKLNRKTYKLKILHLHTNLRRWLHQLWVGTKSCTNSHDFIFKHDTYKSFKWQQNRKLN